ncbi:hypothetical protein scyTo_0010318 [Scyliorhinus torazame]|uniref:Uncharacterized protein n=1 Tax=Scyliorhinus torazame TaxID=75743 RepID=A0A401P471_SCYTO|nr:hypothetical protein [Scyliorhinus torazame]
MPGFFDRACSFKYFNLISTHIAEKHSAINDVLSSVKQQITVADNASHSNYKINVWLSDGTEDPAEGAHFFKVNFLKIKTPF